MLISKVYQPTEMTQFRPISLCNVLYKVIVKVIVNRFRTLLDDCINEAQAKFVPSRQIIDNVLIAYEIFHSLKLKKVVKEAKSPYNLT